MTTLVCRHCSFNTHWEFAILEHTKQHRNYALNNYFYCTDQLNKLKCLECNFRCRSLKKLTDHRNLKHNQLDDSVNQLNEANLNDYQCIECRFTTKWEIELDEHMLHCHQHIKTDSTEIANDEIIEHKHFYNNATNSYLKNDNDLLYKCFFCPFETQYDRNFKDHMRNKHTNLPEKCSFCPFQTKYKHYLNEHIERKHFRGEFKEWKQCKIKHCGYKTVENSKMEEHFLSQHTFAPQDQIIRYKCNYCKFQTKLRSTLAHHENSKHLMSRCQDCNFKTRNNKDFEVHKTFKCQIYKVDELKVDASDDWIKCLHCDYKALRVQDLKTHVLCIHTPYDEIQWFKCRYCDFKAKLKSSTVRHERNRHLHEKLCVS